MAITKKLFSFAGSRLAKRFSKKITAKQLAAARRNIKKAIAARARTAGRVALRSPRAIATPFKAYGRSVARRATKTKVKKLSKIARLKAAQETELASFNKKMLKVGRKLNKLNLENKGIKKQLEKTAAKGMKLSKWDHKTGRLLLKNDNAINRARLKSILKQDLKLTIKYNKNADILREGYFVQGPKVGAKRAAMENSVKDLATYYRQISNANIAFKADVVARDIAIGTVVGSAGVAGAAGYREYKKRKTKPARPRSK